MISEKIHVFKALPDLEQFLEQCISTLQAQTDEISKIIGEKLRTTDSADNEELQELKSKLEGTPTDPKKKNTKKKTQKNNWCSFDAVSVYDGIGLKGELELYFKTLEETKLELDHATKVKQSIDGLINKGLKRDLGCVFVLNQSMPAEIAFTGSVTQRKKFAYKATFDVPVEC